MDFRRTTTFFTIILVATFAKNALKRVTGMLSLRIDFCTPSTGLRKRAKNNCYRGLTELEKLV